MPLDMARRLLGSRIVPGRIDVDIRTDMNMIKVSRALPGTFGLGLAFTEKLLMDGFAWEVMIALDYLYVVTLS